MRLALLAFAAVLTACGGARRDVDATTARVDGLRATVVERAEEGGSWSARWRLCWRPVEGARGYDVTVVTSEGEGRSARRVDGPCWSLTVATGVPRRAQLARQVALVAPALSVRVGAVSRDGRRGPQTPPVPVGARHP